MLRHRVIVCLRGGVGGVDVFSSNLVEELLNQNIDCRIALTTKARDFLPSKLPIDELPIQHNDSWPYRWRVMLSYLEKQGPCIFLPNYNNNYSSISPVLPNKVMVVGIVHSDEAFYYEPAVRLGKYWNGVVAVSEAISKELTRLPLARSLRHTTIPYGVAVPQQINTERSKDARLRIIYVGRLVERQKRVLDLVEILRQLVQQEIKFDFTIVGDGSARAELLERCASILPADSLHYTGYLPNHAVLQKLDSQHVILLTSDFEGLPISILEGMAHGCVPVVTDIRSGVRDLIRDGENGFLVNTAAVAAFAERIGLLYNDRRQWERMSLEAHRSIQTNFRKEQMADRYIQFFKSLEQDTFKRPAGSILPPPGLELSWKQYLPSTLRSAGFLVRNILRKRKFEENA